MKKIISAVLILTLLMAMATTAAASSITDTETGSSQEVLATFKEGVKDKTIISVDISWNQMSFTYKGESEPVWDALEHQYVGEPEDAHWEQSNASITVTNHSNTVLQALINYGHEDAFPEISMLFTDAAPYIGSAYTSQTEAGTPCAVTIQAIPMGELSEETQDNTKIGTVTIKVQAGIDPLEAAIILLERASIYFNKSAENLARGEVYLNPETDVNALMIMIDELTGILCDDTIPEAEKNVAFNAAVTSYYDALLIMQ